MKWNFLSGVKATGKEFHKQSRWRKTANRYAPYISYMMLFRGKCTSNVTNNEAILHIERNDHQRH